MQKQLTKHIQKIVLIGCLISLSGCEYYSDRFKNLGKAPATHKVEVPMERQDYEPVKWSQEELTTARNMKSPNSLWKPGARTFFRDQRARGVGDVLRVKIFISDQANLANNTIQKRTTKDTDSAPNLYGYEQKLGKLFAGTFNPAKLFTLNNSDDHEGNATINRQEQIQTVIAAMVTQILPNGNLVIKGHQEVRVNYELRQVSVEGIVRPEDISSDNEISSDLIAEARIIYGGQGSLSDIQQPRLGTQIMDIISPF